MSKQELTFWVTGKISNYARVSNFFGRWHNFTLSLDLVDEVWRNVEPERIFQLLKTSEKCVPSAHEKKAH